MMPPTKACPKCTEIMVCIVDEPMGRNYWCGFCLHEESEVFDHPHAAELLDRQGEGPPHAE